MSTLLYAFISFSLAASSIYIFNDIKDIEYDKKEVKTNLFVSNRVTIKQGYILSLLFFLLSIAIAFYLKQTHIIALYVLVNVLYSIKLKQIPYLELTCIVFGFVLRVYFGGKVCGIEITNWLYVEVLILTFLIILSKRIKELNTYSQTKILARKVLLKYNYQVLKTLFVLFNVAIVVIYILYCLNNTVQERTSQYIWLTIPFVCFGIVHFVMSTFKSDSLTNPINVLFKNKYILVAVIGWILLWGYLIYA